MDAPRLCLWEENIRVQHVYVRREVLLQLLGLRRDDTGLPRRRLHGPASLQESLDTI
jgi:hypothetical protein